jgi:putative tryptophan/tyrosine transport system substrate-binding protein
MKEGDRQRAPGSSKRRKIMNKGLVVSILATLILASAHLADAAQAKFYRVGVVLYGGEWYAVLDGLREGLRELGLEEGKHFAMEIRDTKGDLKAVDEAARNLERDKVDLLYAIATSVTMAVRRATAHIPIVFCAGTDPVALGIVDSFANPGGRLTGVHLQVADLTAKRLEILKEILPKVRRVLTFYDSNNRSSQEAAREGREAAQQLGVQFVERHVPSIAELQTALRVLRTGEADAYLLLSDQITVSQAQLIIDTAKAKRLPTMFFERTQVVNGGLASYGVSYHEAGRLSAKYIQRILAGASPKELAVETLHKLELVVNLRTAKEIGITIPPEVLAKADKVIK